MKEFRDRGTTIFLVTHSMSTVREICHSAAWIHKGELRMHGDSESVVDAYVEERRLHREKKNPKLRA